VGAAAERRPENRAGVALQFAPAATPQSIEQDLETARAILKAVEE